MIIVHVQLPSPFIDGWGYQENGLSYIEAKQGHKVYVLAANYILTPNNKMQYVEEGFHESVEGALVYRIKPKTCHFLPFLTNILNRYSIYNLLESIKPDLIMIHGLAQGFYIYDIQL